MEMLSNVLGSSKATLQEVGFSPGDPLPTNETVRDAFSNVVENTAFFGDLALRLPDITHKIYDGNKEWVLLMGWAVSFSNSSSIFASTDNELLNLMAQELNFIDRDPSYVNPYTAEYEKMVAKQMAKEGKSKKKKRTIKKGPRMSSVRNEL
ncbi:coiled-coil domain-containing protein 134-like isoform X2 [Tubulanus polymorphus]|uniref:coiled-coil domain-containing protein 134-like isoform X2 n=1 Tax=Tubulanus polymorphus TaxID=672921 RepID=UPI003DA2DE5E